MKKPVHPETLVQPNEQIVLLMELQQQQQKLPLHQWKRKEKVNVPMHSTKGFNFSSIRQESPFPHPRIMTSRRQEFSKAKSLLRSLWVLSSVGIYSMSLRASV